MMSGDILAAADWSFPVPISYGPGRICELGDLCRRSGMMRPLIVTDRGSRDLPFIAQARDIITAAGLRPGLFAEVAPNPTDANVFAGRGVFRAGGHDGLVAIGGGSGMDGAKAIGLLAHNDRDLRDFDLDKEPPPSEALSLLPPLICIPTTAGTGAETESTAMVTDSERGIKLCIWHPDQRPKAVILDPELTLGLPRNLTAWTGCDALVHAIEALSVPQWHPLCDGLALEAIRLIARWLPRAARDGSDLEARGAMLAGSCLAGISFLKGLGLVHAISHMVGAVYDSHHGLTNAVLLPAVLRYNEAGLGDKTALMCQAMELPGEDFECLHGAVVTLLEALQIPRDLATLGVSAERAREIAEKAYGDPGRISNPVPARVTDIEILVEEAVRRAW